MEKPDISSSMVSEPGDRLLGDDPAFQRPKRPWSFCRPQFAFNVVAIIYVLITIPLLASRHVSPSLQPHSPANHLISYELHPLLFHEFDPRFYGKPEDVDEHWAHLLEPLTFRASTEDLEQAHSELSDDLVGLPDGGSPAVLAVYHELHCLDALRKNIRRDYYFQNLTEEEEEFNNYHREHCIESIRRTLMCKADAAFYSTYWIGPESKLQSKELRSNSQQVCTNWDDIDGWVRGRMLEKHKFLVNPGPFE